ncbi:MAG: hypothetical protein K9L17_04170 [Clostridiales bacterium]|nr:hypothetical protein [Clostridiales bacterium]MCF8021876.1 hypothetical protein [Clostridiales bacterium]
MLVLLILSAIFIVILDVPRLVCQKLWRELGSFMAILVAAYILVYLQLIDIL